MAPVNILVIDDEIVICKACSLILADDDHLVNYCTTGKAGMDEIRQHGYDLILLDIKLPDLDGMEILKTIHETKPTLQVVVMTGHSTIQNAVEAMKLGAFDYLTKPFTDDQLIMAAKNALEKKRLVEENLSLRKELFNRFSFENIVGEDSKIIQVFKQIEKVAPTESTVLLYGESGTGKELFAGAIHTHSRRAFRQIIPVDCSALSPNLLESELFGHVKGAFTGALRDKEGLFEVANGGTLFMDDVTNLDLEIQAKLLRVLESGEFKPVGATHQKKTDIRIIAATNRDLKKMVEAGKFREDLFYRLNVFPIDIPPFGKEKKIFPNSLTIF